jgi:hypothetical protein
LGSGDLTEIYPAEAQELGIEQRFGWHTFRHTYSTLIRSVGTEFKVMQERLRHSSLRSTLDVYTQAITPSKHAAQEVVMSLVLSAGGTQTSAYSAPGNARELTAKKGKKGHISSDVTVLA